MRRVRSLARSFVQDDDQLLSTLQTFLFFSLFLFSYFITETRLLKLVGPWTRSYTTVRAPLCVCISRSKVRSVRHQGPFMFTFRSFFSPFNILQLNWT